MRTICILLILFPLSLLISIHGQTKKRNVFDYEAGAVYDERAQLSNPTADVRKSAKNYLLEAWRNKKQVYFKVVRYSREGVKNSCLYFLEKSPDGNWQVATECSSEGCPFMSERDCKKVTTAENVYDLIEDVSDGTNDTYQQPLFGPAVVVLTNRKTGQKHHF